MSEFRAHYERLNDEHLIEIALTRELRPQAREALQHELTKRGIHDLSSHRATRQREITQEYLHWRAQIELRAKTSVWKTRIFLGMSMLMCAYGGYNIAIPNKQDSVDDGGLVLAMGIALFLFSAITGWLSKIWNRRLLNQPPPF